MEHNVENRQLRYLVAVADVGSITQAARRLRVAQPSLSQQIKTIERRVGVPLIVRGATGITLTESGATFVETARKILSDLDAAIATARSTPRDIRIGVCIGAPATLLIELERALRTALKEDDVPTGEIVFDSIDSARQSALVRAGELDFGVLRCPVDGVGLHRRSVFQADLGIVVHDQHPLAERTSIELAELGSQTLLWFDEIRAPDYANSVLERVHSAGWHPRLRPVSHARHSLFVRELCSADDVVALRPRGVESGEPRLRWIPIAADSPREHIMLVTSGDGQWLGILDKTAAFVAE